MNVIDLFSGCGGFTEGFIQSNGFKFLAHVEWDKHAIKVLQERLKFHNEDIAKTIFFDIQRTQELFNGFQNDPNYGSHLGLDKCVGEKKVNLIIGGPPCQAYSIAGRIRDEFGMKNDYRNYLFESFIAVIKRYEPDFFIFENVLGIFSAKPGNISIISRIKESFNHAGYLTCPNYKDAVFDLSEYGVPQKRKRVIIFGVNQKIKNSADLINLFYQENFLIKEPPVTAQDAIGKLPPIFINNDSTNKSSHIASCDKDSNHQPRYHNQRDIRTFYMLSTDLQAGTNLYTSTEALKKLYTERTGKTSSVHKYHVIRPDEPSNTIPAHLYKDGLRHIHWDPIQSRTITVREAACLQGFPLDFMFNTSMGSAYKMIGNAVPPSFAKKIANSIKAIYKLKEEG